MNSEAAFRVELNKTYYLPTPINIYIASLDLPDEGFTINRKLAERCSSFTPNPFPDVISQVNIYSIDASDTVVVSISVTKIGQSQKYTLRMK